MAEEKAFLEFGEREAQILAARDVGKLSTMQKQRLAENGLISPLVFMLQTQDYESVEAALFALLNLAFGSERNKLRIAQSGAIPAILKILQWRNESLLELALAALLILSSCSGNKPEIASSGAVQLLIQLLPSEFLKWAATRVLVEAVDGTGPCKEHAVGILVQICRSCRDRYRGMILREGAMPGLLQLSVDGSRQAREKAKALLFLLRDCSHGGSSRVKQSKRVLFEEVMRQIDGGGRAGTSIQLVEEMIAKLRT
ncbi:UNVERIFIED_CONTAM: hypothetical protein Sradi_4254100 [Sesamum radiatum]|uniref:Uncharacterized protein n=1 Tax=Sesamum radiatum TaxID=300843 RepID=A0AAW2P4X7_SESRA